MAAGPNLIHFEVTLFYSVNMLPLVAVSNACVSMLTPGICNQEDCNERHQQSNLVTKRRPIIPAYLSQNQEEKRIRG